MASKWWLALFLAAASVPTELYGVLCTGQQCRQIDALVHQPHQTYQPGEPTTANEIAFSGTRVVSGPRLAVPIDWSAVVKSGPPDIWKL